MPWASMISRWDWPHHGLGHLLAGAPVPAKHLVGERQIAHVEQVIHARLAGERDCRADDVGVCRRRCLGHGRRVPCYAENGRPVMKLTRIRGWLSRWLPGSLPLLVSLVVIGVAFDVVTRSRLSATSALACEGEYADSLQVQSMHSRDVEQGPKSQYSYLVRSSAKYECPFFGPDGKLRRRRVQASELGTAFAYEAVRQRHLPVHQRARGGLARGHGHLAPHRRRARGVQAGGGTAAHRARRARRLRSRADRAPARRRRPDARRRHPEGQPEADRPPLQDRQERGASAGKRGRSCAASPSASCRRCRAARS